MKKLLIVAAGVAGYVLGSRAGRERYEQIRTQSQKVWNSPTVQSGVDHAADAAKSAASAAGSAAAGAASTAGHKVAEAVSDAVSHRDDDDVVTEAAEKVGEVAEDVADRTEDAADRADDDVQVPASPAATAPTTAADILDGKAERP